MTRCIDSPFTDIYFHLAAEEYLLKQGTENVFMLWQDTSSVVMGKHQRVQAEVDREWADRQGIHLARRFSGGGTVYHDLGNVNLTFIESSSRLPDFTNYLHRTLDFLSSIGLNAEGDERMGIYLDGLKISGSAQCVHKNRVLYHCTLLYDTDLDVLNKVITPKKIDEDEQVPTSYGVPSVRSEVTNIRKSLSSEEATSNLRSIHHFRKAAFQYFSSNQKSDSFSETELTAIRRLRNEKYIQQKWILNR